MGRTSQTVCFDWACTCEIEKSLLRISVRNTAFLHSEGLLGLCYGGVRPTSRNNISLSLFCFLVIFEISIYIQILTSGILTKGRRTLNRLKNRRLEKSVLTWRTQRKKWGAMGSDWCHVCGAQALPEEKVVRRIGFLRVRGRLSELPFVNIPEVSISYKYSFITGINIIFK